MGIYANAAVELEKMINKAYTDSRQSRNNVERTVYADYILQLQELRGNVVGKKEKTNLSKILGSKSEARQYEVFMTSLDQRCVLDYLENQRFHNEYFGEIFDIENELLKDFLDVELMEFTEIPEEEFLEYIYEFLKMYKLDGIFDKIVESKRAFLVPFYYDKNYLGGCFHEPFSKETSLALCSFNYNLLYMSVLVHEIGHAYDVGCFDYLDSGINFLRYSYSTCNSEIVPIMFEKLFIDFMLEKKYFEDEANNLAINTLLVGRDRVIDAYLLSLLDKKTIIRGPKTYRPKDILKKVGSQFESEDGLLDYIKDSDLDPFLTQKYGYGEVVGTFLKEEVKADGLNNRLLNDVLEIRPKLFNPSFVGERFDAFTYQKVLKRDIEGLKK